jgi:hypothetical protein
MNRVRAGDAGYVNPFGGKRHTVSLRTEDVLFIVFWSKNFGPFLENLDALDRMGFNFYFHFTITGLPQLLENNVPPWREAVKTARALAERFSPEHVLWRLDPIVFSSSTPPEVTYETFCNIAESLEGATRRCYFSFVNYYGKVQRNFESLHLKHGITFRADAEESERLSKSPGAAGKAFSFDLGREEKIRFAGELAEIAGARGISMHTCCGDYLIGRGGPPILKAHCVDADLISALVGGIEIPIKEKPTRKDCGCFESRDIGAYDTCPHGCYYCYANANKEVAEKKFEKLRAAPDSFSLSPGLPRSDFPEIESANPGLFS